MKGFNKLWPLLALLNGCSSIETHWDPQKNSATKASHEKVLKELERNIQRVPASAFNDLGINFNDLRRISPGKFEVYLFPKVSAQQMKEELDEEVYLGPPQVFEISVQVVSSCRQFIHAGLFAKLKASQAFPVELSEDSQRQCAILEIRDKRLNNIDKALLRQDDQLSVRLFIDDNYRIHATDHTLYESRNKNRVVRRLSEKEALTSALSYFPMDMPMSGSTLQKAELQKYFSNKLDPIASYQIQKRFSRSFQAPKCEGIVFSARDPLGGEFRVGWCRGVPWPSYSENSRFFSVTQLLRVR